MRRSIAELDRLLRGEATKPAALKKGALEIDAGGLTVIILALGMFYGACMGSFGIAQKGIGALPQLVASTGKVPLLFLLTLIVTFPSLYVFNALVGSRLTLASTLRLIVAAMAIMLAVLASLGTIVAFFSVSTTDYAFMLLLNVLVFTISGFLGMKFLLHTLHRLTVMQDAKEFAATAASEETPSPAGALDKMDGHAVGANVTTIFRIWIVVFGLVGAQMGWVLRPFIGAPNTPFSLFRTRESNFFEAVLHAIGKLFGA
jgi:hypothetical protein